MAVKLCLQWPVASEHCAATFESDCLFALRMTAEAVVFPVTVRSTVASGGVVDG